MTELNDTFSHLDAVEQLLLLTSISFARLPSATFNHRVSEATLLSCDNRDQRVLQVARFKSTFLNACQRDLQYFGVCLLELILLSKQHYISANCNGAQRLAAAKQLLNNNGQLIPV